jgi:hypothetical protein
VIGVDGLILVRRHHHIVPVVQRHAEIVLVHHPRRRTVRKGGCEARHGIDAVRARIEGRDPLVLSLVLEFLLYRKLGDRKGKVTLALSKGSRLRDTTGSMDLVGSRIDVVVRGRGTLRGVRGQVIAPRDICRACDAVRERRSIDGSVIAQHALHTRHTSLCREPRHSRCR